MTILEIDKGYIHVFGYGFSAKKAVTFKMREIKDRSLREMYDLFKTVCDNAHTDLDTVEVTFLVGTGCTRKRGQVDLLWTCRHFEDPDPIDLAVIIKAMQRDFWNWIGSSVNLEVADNFQEKLIIHCYGVPFKFTTAAKDVVNFGMDYGEGRSQLTDAEFEKANAEETYDCSCDVSIKSEAKKE